MWRGSGRSQRTPVSCPGDLQGTAVGSHESCLEGRSVWMQEQMGRTQQKAFSSLRTREWGGGHGQE